MPSQGLPDHVPPRRCCGTYPLIQPSNMLTCQWAGVAYALPEQREPLRLAEVNKYADSFCTNMHKWGLVGFDCCEWCLAFSACWFVHDELRPLQPWRLGAAIGFSRAREAGVDGRARGPSVGLPW